MDKKDADEKKDNISGFPQVCYPLRLSPGEEVTSRLEQFVREASLKAAYIITCVGSVTSVKLRMADSKTIKVYNTGNYEIVSLVGTVSAGGHLHASFSDDQGNVFGGHVMGDMYVYTTAEIILGDCQGAVFTREYDEKSGYPELVIKTQ